MKRNLKSLTAAALVAFVTLSTGCASLSLEGDGHAAQRPDILSQLEDDSRGK